MRNSGNPIRLTLRFPSCYTPRGQRRGEYSGNDKLAVLESPSYPALPAWKPNVARARVSVVPHGSCSNPLPVPSAYRHEATNSLALLLPALCINGHGRNAFLHGLQNAPYLRGGATRWP